MSSSGYAVHLRKTMKKQDITMVDYARVVEELCEMSEIADNLQTEVETRELIIVRLKAQIYDLKQQLDKLEKA
mgnify:CR=1 FL=1